MSTSSQVTTSTFFVNRSVALILDCLIPVTSSPSSRCTQKSTSFFFMLRIHSQERQATSQVSIKIAGLILEKSSPWSVNTDRRKLLSRLWNSVRLKRWRGVLVSFPKENPCSSSIEKLIVDNFRRQDGHWFPETYLLAVIQIREGLRKVLGMCVERESLTIKESVKVVQDILFNTANQLYGLHLSLVPVGLTILSDPSPSKASWTNNFAQLERFIDQEPSIQFLRLQWLDYTNILRLRILPIKQALRMFSNGQFISIVEAVLGLLQTDSICPGFSASDEYSLYPQFAGTYVFCQVPNSGLDLDIFIRSPLRESQRLCNRPV